MMARHSMGALARLMEWRDGDIGSEHVVEDLRTLGRIGSQLRDEFRARTAQGGAVPGLNVERDPELIG